MLLSPQQWLETSPWQKQGAAGRNENGEGLIQPCSWEQILFVASSGAKEIFLNVFKRIVKNKNKEELEEEKEDMKRKRNKKMWERRERWEEEKEGREEGLEG